MPTPFSMLVFHNNPNNSNTDVYKKLKRQYPDYGVTDIAKKAGEMWRKLSAEKKAVYEQMAKKDKARAAKEKVINCDLLF
jgi:hypothetical protein